MTTTYLATSDWHIHSWFQHSDVDETGVPSRLTLYKDLARDIVAIGKEQGATVLLFTGDWLHYHSPKPMVLNVAIECLDILAEGFEQVIVMDGNHDVDQKTGAYDDYHSGFRAIQGRWANVQYVDRPDIYDVGGTKIYVRPWNHEIADYSEFVDADIFMGHGLVSGSTDPHGHVFNNGYSVPELGAKYKLAIVGDIHKGQVMRDAATGHATLIPGQPIQINHVSDENCGVWTFNDSDWKLVFHSITNDQNLGDNAYHRFFKRDEAIAGAPDYVHFRGTTASRTPGLPLAGQAAPAAVAVDIPQLVKDELVEFKVKDTKAASLLVDVLFSGYSASTPTFHITPALIGKVSISNFGSVQSLEVDLNDWKGEVLITGRNGSGKSTLLEAIYWAITGETTKDLEVSKITRLGAKTPAEVAVEWVAGTKTYRVVRSRDTDRLLTLFVAGADVTRSSTAETQKFIYHALGVNDHRDVLALMYFSVKEAVNFTDMSASQQYGVLGRLVDMDFFQHFAKEAGARHEALQTKRQQLASREDLLSEQILTKAQQLATAKGTSDDNPHVADLTEKYKLPAGQTISSLKGALEAAAENLRKQISPQDANEVGRKQQELFVLRTEVKQLERQSEANKTAVAANQVKHTSYSKCECPECHQAIPADPEKLKVLLDDTRAKMAENRTAAARLAAVALSIETNEADLARIQRQVDSDKSYRSQVDMIEYDLSRLLSYSGGYSQTLVDHMTAELKQLGADQEAARVALSETAAEWELLVIIKSKILAKNAAINAKIYQSVFDRLIATINVLADPKVLKARSEAKKGLAMQMSFGGNDWVSPKSFSTGEKRLADVLTLIALNSLIYAHYGVKGGFLGLAGYDEVMTYLDPVALDAAQAAIAALDCRTKLIVTHDEGLMSYYSQSIKVTKTKGVSQYQMINFNA